MFSMGRDRHLPLGGAWGHVNTRFRTPANAAIARRRPRRDPDPRRRAGDRRSTSSIAATGLIYVAYFLCNIGVLVARLRGWPHQKAWFSLGRWGMLINILALVWGGLMIINIALWADRTLFGDCGTDRATPVRTRSSTRSSSRSATRSQGLPAWPIFETLVGVDPHRRRRSTTCVAVRGKAPTVEIEADVVTGEAVIG